MELPDLSGSGLLCPVEDEDSDGSAMMMVKGPMQGGRSLWLVWALTASA